MERGPGPDERPPQIAAVVLSCDKYHPLAEHMIHRYELLWPGHPFRFHVPFQSEPVAASSKALAANPLVKLVQTPPDIRATVLALLEEFDDAAWVYWCIDDKYVVELDAEVMHQTVRWLPELSDDVHGVLLCRARKLLGDALLRRAEPIQAPWGERFYIRSTYHQFWLHSFIRAGVIRDLFLAFPDRPFLAKEMDVFTGQVDGVPDLRIAKETVLLVSEHNHVVFGESTSSGKLTRNAVDSMAEVGLATPAEFQVGGRALIIGQSLSE